MTFNVEVFNTAKGNTSKISNRIIRYQPDIVLLQETLYPSPLSPITGYANIGVCIAEPLTWKQVQDYFPSSQNLSLANSIWVKQSFLETHPILKLETFNMSHLSSTPRCSVIAFFKDFSVANVHLAGGRFDDETFANEHTPDVMLSKDISLYYLIQAYHPTIVGGDFNGEVDPEKVNKDLAKYTLYQRLSESARRRFRYFFTSGHGTLSAFGYAPIYDEKDMISTTRFGPVADWIYSNRMFTVNHQSLIYALDISDHNVVMVDIELEPSTLYSVEL